ncbi:MAG: amidase [Microbacteriaceae bacterium]|nr:amidase [Burkholderiaceae bacterium]
MPHDLSSALAALQDGRLSAADALAKNLLAAETQAGSAAFIRLFGASTTATAAAADSLAQRGVPRGALGGLAISIKDLFDVAGAPTTAGSRVLADAAPAAQDCPAVARLRNAGAALIGHTHMSEFAFSGVGLNPHHAALSNPVTHAIDGEDRIPGGSSSGAAASVASGAAWAALGSDTGGSIRIPAALQGLVGFKNTARLTPTEGTIPLSPTLDTACAITRSVRDALLLHELLSARKVTLAGRPLAACRFALVKPLFQDGLDAQVSAAFERSLSRLRAAGARIEEIDLPELQHLPTIKARGTLTAAEAWAWHRQMLAVHEPLYDPRVAQRIRLGERISAADYLELQATCQHFVHTVTNRLRGFDAVISPTVPIVAPLLAPLVASDAAFFAANALLLRNTAVINAIDGCAISLPCQASGELPVGLMLWSSAMQDDVLLDVALQVEAALAEPRA